MKTAAQFLNDMGYTRSDPEINFDMLEGLVRDAQTEAVKECADELQKLRNQYEVLNGNYVVSVYPIDHLIENFENKIDHFK